ncbi:MAG: aspartate-semialdehyde dehydrogenase [Deltaproteobacteria bacterium]|nr:aspartate-semialdehyde dehydrogenase [Deltaproteobacteria bacterium]
MNISVVGATGLVGREVIETLESRNFPVDRIRFFASSHSTGEMLVWRESSLSVEVLDEEHFHPASGELVFMCVDAAISRHFVPQALDCGAIVIDNSSAFRLEPDVPLIVPEVNGDLLQEGGVSLIANPNCSTAQLVMALAPLASEFGLQRVIVSTYQSTAGVGQDGIDELSSQVVSLLNQKPISTAIFPRQIAFNCIPQIGPFDEEGNSEEELKIVGETRKILRLPDLAVAATAVRVPTFCGHAQAVLAETNTPVTPADVFAVFSGRRGVTVYPHQEEYPDVISSIGTDDVLIGRIRRDPTVPFGIQFWTVADNLRKGAALNAVQIAEMLL